MHRPDPTSIYDIIEGYSRRMPVLVHYVGDIHWETSKLTNAHKPNHANHGGVKVTSEPKKLKEADGPCTDGSLFDPDDFPGHPPFLVSQAAAGVGPSHHPVGRGTRSAGTRGGRGRLQRHSSHAGKWNDKAAEATLFSNEFLGHRLFF